MRNLLYRWRRVPVVRILAFHDVHPGQVPSFRRQLEILKGEANIVSLGDILAGRLSWRRLNVAITFDDGYRGWLHNVCPALRDLGIGATFFVSSGFIGLVGEEERDFLRNNLKSDRPHSGVLDARELREIAAQGFAIGGHTRRHVNLAKVEDVDELRSEIEVDKAQLERMTGAKVEYFAYPFGASRHGRIDLARVLEECGYRGAVTLVPGPVTSGTDGYRLNRDLVNASMSVPVFRARLGGNHDGVAFVRRFLGLRRRAQGRGGAGEALHSQ